MHLKDFLSSYITYLNLKQIRQPQGRILLELKQETNYIDQFCFIKYEIIYILEHKWSCSRLQMECLKEESNPSARHFPLDHKAKQEECMWFHWTLSLTYC